jgi:hypothetical protein
MIMIHRLRPVLDKPEAVLELMYRCPTQMAFT